ncbi:acetate--CoA ligase family protein [Calothrix sp. UHCC 0171]|uniref:acetate--CoA ligase family protein n=1 Tax=Calothrix sp. UHCC 0171 TaxID=3110245 RepID=UPI002B200504|nr:acetate--CoA ligase family protein [Calothrix sp. UHCC 0171]MEA5573995.1 acetate--CoA ligase family protein [Calothrix sp. UHCC 0171]
MVKYNRNETVRINARKTDVFDIFNFKHYAGANPYLSAGALVFDFAITDEREALPLGDYLEQVCQYFPDLRNDTYESHAQLFAHTASKMGKLEMDLHLDKLSVKPGAEKSTIAIQSLHERTTRTVIYFVWDWFEAITQNEDIVFDEQLTVLQNRFRQSVYGGPTVYALWRTAEKKGIPVFYLWEEGLTQYGFGKNHIRGIATTFDCDSHVDSDFTTRKDDCKAFLKSLGFPVPEGEIVKSDREALAVAREIGYPIAIKPVVGHKGIGVTADISSPRELELAYSRAVAAIPENQPIRIIVEKSIKGSDFRLLCVNGQFVAATERRPASVIGDGYSTINELIREENRQPARRDTPTSAMSKIQCDEAMKLYLEEQGLSLDSVIEKDEKIYLRKVANLSAGGVSIDATSTIHPDNIILAQDIDQYFRLTCLGIDVITESLEKSWKEGNFAILEINAAPGILMHLNPAMGDSVDVPSHILNTFFESGDAARIPIITFNQISVQELQETIDHILSQNPDWTIGAVCRKGVFINRSEKVLSPDYNNNVQNLLRNPNLDLLITEYNEDILEKDGMFYYGSNMVVLDNPTDTEMMLARDILENATLIVRKSHNITIHRQGLLEEYSLGENEPFTRVYLKKINTIM